MFFELGFHNDPGIFKERQNEHHFSAVIVCGNQQQPLQGMWLTVMGCKNA